MCIRDSDEDFVLETITTLENLIDLESLTDDEIDVLGELLSNFSGAIEVHKDMKNGLNKKDALNTFMKRVLGSID